MVYRSSLQNTLHFGVASHLFWPWGATLSYNFHFAWPKNGSELFEVVIVTIPSSTSLLTYLYNIIMSLLAKNISEYFFNTSLAIHLNSQSHFSGSCWSLVIHWWSPSRILTAVAGGKKGGTVSISLSSTQNHKKTPTEDMLVSKSINGFEPLPNLH